jgi:hypothetical protein
VNRLPMSRAAAALLRSLLARSPDDRDRILLTEYRTIDWQSLTFIGERHEFRFRIAGPDGDSAFQRLTAGIGEAELSLPGHVVADIAVSGEPERERDGSIRFGIEALTIAED